MTTVMSLSVRPLAAEPVPVRHMLGTFHGFLLLKTEDGKTIAAGDLVQICQGRRVTLRLVFRFRDGSLDEETAVFSQRKVLQLISDHHTQLGPSFPQPLDMALNVASGEVRYRDEDGTMTAEHLDLSPEDCNGLFIPLLMNVDPKGAPIRLPMVAATPRPRLIHLVFSAESEEPLSIGGLRKEATDFRLRVELGGIAGVVAPILGKQPSDIHAWILEGEAPALVRGEGQFYEGGPVWRIELAAPVFPRTQ